MFRILGPAAAALVFAASGAVAQQSAPIPLGGQAVEITSGTPIDALGGSNLPGVGLDVGNAGSGSPSGPGGLRNGVGAFGTMAPDSSGTAGNARTRVPGAIPDTNSGVGIPLSTQGEPVN